MPSYPGISSEAFRHPLDRQAEEALRSVPGFDLAARKFIEFVYERPQFVYLMGNGIQVGPRQYATLYQIFRDCVRDLDIQPEPNLFVSQNPQVNSYALGQEQPTIVIQTGLLDLLDEAEIRTVLAHELGHVKCGHTVLIQMAIWAMTATAFLGDLTLGIGNVITSGLLYAFYEWRRKAELSSDRAALLVTDDLDLVMRSMMQLAGGSNKFGHEASLSEFIKQSEQYQSLDKDDLNQVYKFLLYNGSQGTFLSHPFPAERIHHLRDWSQTDAYQKICTGSYPQATPDAVEVDSSPSSAATDLQQQIDELQQEIDRIRRAQQ